MKLETARAAGRDLTSHPARGAWIEILVSRTRVMVGVVAPRTGCVD